LQPNELRTIRQRYGLTIRGLAGLLRIRDEKTIRRWEKGEVPVSGPASIVLELMDADELPNRFWP
jgi:DNA-binding transcriptional regulator YiaG